MLKRTLFFGNPGKLSIQNSLLFWQDQKGEKRTFPLEDLGFIVLESREILISTYCLASLAENNIAVIFCGASHLPLAQLLPYTANTLTQKYTQAQFTASDALKGRLWKQTVSAKIRNQAHCLQRLGLPGEKLLYLAKNVKKDDLNNYEAVAAREYFKQLSTIQQNFTRERNGDAPNPALNYGYAILRAAVARGLIGSGLHCILGIHHANGYNAFGLADDIMEPYRPFADELVFSEPDFFNVPELGTREKAKLLQILTMDVMLEKEKRPLMNGISYTTASLARCFLKEETCITYPEFVPCQQNITQ